MPRRVLRFSAVLLGALVAISARTAAAGDMDLEDDSDEEHANPAEPANAPLSAAPIATIKPRAYNLGECLMLAERNHPNLWAARARLAFVHGQLDEARWTPFSQASANANFGYLPPLGGTPFYNGTPYTVLYRGIGDGWEPAFSMGIRYNLPLYTFGKIEAVKKSAEANVRVSEWDLEKTRQQIRMDVRRAFYGLMLARDMQYIAKDIIDKLDKGIRGMQAKLDRGDTSVDEPDRLRLEVARDELLARIAEARKGEALASAALRFLTGVQTNFDIPDEPLARPEVQVGPVVRYLTAARLFRPEINMARAGIVARRNWLDYMRAQLFPNIGLGLFSNYSVAPSATPQRTAWIGDPFNRFGTGFGIGLEWGLDLLPKQARVLQAESQLEESRALERLALGGIGVEVEHAYAAVVETKTREENWDRAEHRSKKWISSVQDAIDLGTKDERFLIEPLRLYVFARANHAQALMDLHVALSELARVTGWDAVAPKS